jgi:TP901 family phage tail tape measure protein
MRAIGAGATAGAIRGVQGAMGGLAKGTSAAGRQVGKMPGRMKAMGGSMIAAGKAGGTAGIALSKGLSLPIALIGGISVKMATDFQSSMARVSSLVGVPIPVVKRLSNEVLNLAGKTGRAPIELSDALYFLTSSGLSAQSVADAVSSVMNAYGHETISAARATDILTATVREGKAEPEELARTIGHLLPIAANLNVPFKQVGGTIAGLSLQGLNASESVTSLRQIMQKLIRPTFRGRATLAQYGLSLKEVQQNINRRGLLPGLRWLSKRFDGNRKSLSYLFNTHEGYNGVLALTGKHAKQAGDAYKGVMGSTNDLNKAFKVTSQTAKFKFDQAMASLKVSAIRLGNAIKPVLIPILKGLASTISKVAHWFDKLSPSTKKIIVVVGLLLAAIGPLVVGIAALTVALGILAANPIVLIIAGVIALIAAVVIAYHKFQTFRSVVDTLWSVFKWTPFGLVIQGLMGLLRVVMRVIGWIVKHSKGIWNGLSSGITAVIQFVVDKLNWLIRAYNSTLGKLLGTINEIVTAADRAKSGIEKIPGIGGGLNPTVSGTSVGDRTSNRQTVAGHGIGGGARGGVVGREGIMLVGELGPEHAYLPRGSIIKPYDALSEESMPRHTGRPVIVAPPSLDGLVLESHVTSTIDGKPVAKAVHRQGVKKKATR